MEQLFMTLSAKQFIIKYDTCRDEHGNFVIRYSFDYTNRYERHSYISCMDTFDECALLYQLEKSYPTGKNYDIDSVNTALVFVDFEGIFHANDTSSAQTLDIGSYTEQDLSPFSTTISDNTRLQFFFRNGFQIKYSEDLTITYIPFEKSNSMARNNKMSFIASELYDAVNTRLHLGLPFEDMTLTLSKFFAYKGLYLSSGQRVACDELVLNEKTVIVIKDATFPVKNQSVITADSEEHIIEYPDYSFKVESAFDGEGIISPQYAAMINRTLFPNTKAATSFQIRMPFSKGMLHQVDFQRFLSEEAGFDSDNDYQIIDFFGIPRNLKEAHIIMSDTMFKAGKWIKSQENIADPMKYFFDEFRKYEHALYITNTNLGIRRTGITTLGYQLLNPLRLTKKQLDAIAANHFEISDDPITYLLQSSKNSEEAWISALSKSHVFSHDTTIKNELSKTSNGLKRASGEGKFLVEGEYRYLSRDLLHFLTRLLRLIYKQHNDPRLMARIKEIENKNLYADKFYMPDNVLGLRSDAPCAIFRSPHLSRNEQCLLKNYTADKKSLYHKYFSHLSGIIMVSFKSLDPQALGGADFDGDQVKIISNKHVVNAVSAGAYNLNNKQNYVRKLPIILIPSREGTTADGCNYQSLEYFNTIKNTFSSRVGKISNMAIRLGQKQYSGADELKHTCAECTIFTGLEIDAAKSGVHPNLSALIGYCNSLELDFDYIEDFHKPLKKHNEKPGYEIYKPKLSHTLPEDENDYIQPLAHLPYYYKEYVEKEWKPEVLDNEKVNGKYQYFTFLESDAWKSSLDRDLIQKINAVTGAYNSVLKISRNVNNYVSYQKNSTYAGHIFNTIAKQYDKYKATAFFNETYLALFHYLDIHFASTQEATDALNRLRKSNWPFLLKEQRKNVLAEILGLDTDEAENKIFAPLLNFNEQGYYLLFYFLLDVISLKANNAATEEHAEYYKDNLNVNLSDMNQKYYERAFEYCYNYYLEQTAFCKPDRIWRNILRRMCLSYIQNLIDSSKEQETFVKTLYASKDRNFFWDCVTAEDLAPYIIVQEGIQC